MTQTFLPTLPADAQALLDEANALFPGRYVQIADPHGGHRVWIQDTHTQKPVAIDSDGLRAARKALTSAKISANNGNRQTAQGQPNRQLSVQLPHAAYLRLEAEAQERGITVKELAFLKLTQ